MPFCQYITNKQTWDNFIITQSNHTFLHSWNWGEFNEQMGDKVWRIGIYDNGQLVAGALVIKVHAKRGNFLFVPHGPIFDEGKNMENHKPKTPSSNHKQNKNNKNQIFETLLNRVRNIANEENVSFIRISPLLEKTEENEKLFQELGFRPAPIHMHAEITWTLDLTPNEDELLANMRKTTRNLIRRAIKDGVKIKTGNSEDQLKAFNNLYQETARRHIFTPFSYKYLKTQCENFKIDNSIQIFEAWYNTRILSSAIIVFYGSSAYYHHGASTPSKVPAAYLLQWEAIREAKRRGHKFYNFWGIISEDASKNHPWAGITLFKKGFGGFQTDYVHAQDMPTSWKYWINWGVETLRRKRRNL